MAIGKCVPLVSLMVQMAATHIDTCKLLKTSLQNYISTPLMI